MREFYPLEREKGIDEQLRRLHRSASRDLGRDCTDKLSLALAVPPRVSAIVSCAAGAGVFIAQSLDPTILPQSPRLPADVAGAIGS